MFGLLTDDLASSVLSELDEEDQGRLILQQDPQRIINLIHLLDSDDGADLLGYLPEEKRVEILSLLPEDKRSELTNLLKYEPDTAGGIMATEAVSVSASTSVAAVIDHLRAVADEVDDIYRIYIVDESEKLIGAVSLKDILIATPDQHISELVKDFPVPVTVGMDREEVAELFSRYSLASAPVVNSQGKFLGRITHDDILDAVTEEVHEDIAHFTGHTDFDPGEKSIRRNLQSRMPWLMLGLAGGVFTASILSRFEPQFTRITSIVFFLPLVAAMGGNAGIQTSSLIVRGLATGEIKGYGLVSRMFRELLISLLAGIACGGVIFVITWMWQLDIELAVVVGSSLLLVIVFAASFGAVVPVWLKKLGLDPALATGPFITTTNDVLGLLIYLWIASAVLNGH